jgi:hypothetical protein
VLGLVAGVMLVALERWSGSRNAAIVLGKKECWGNTIAGNNHVIINVIVIVCKDLEGVVMLCQTLVHDR